MQIAVGKKMFAWGAHRGCILVQDKHDGQIHVIKKSFNIDEPVENVYNAVKIEAIADLMAQCYNAKNPPRKVVFVPCFIYILAQRPQQPAVRVEPLIFNHDKARLRNIPDVSQEELDTLEAFELFSYQESEKSFVICNPCRVGEFWTEPEFHSVEGQLGGERNRGVKGLNVFLLRHQYNETCRKMGLKNPASLFVEATTRQLLQEEDAVRARQLRLDPTSASANLDKMRKIVEGEGDVAQMPPSLLSVSMPPRFPYYAQNHSPEEEEEEQVPAAPLVQQEFPAKPAPEAGPEFPAVRPGSMPVALTIEDHTERAEDAKAAGAHVAPDDEPDMAGQGRSAVRASGAGQKAPTKGAGVSAKDVGGVKGISGVLLNQPLVGDYFFIEEVIRNGPAERSGVRKDDILLGVDGVTVAGKSTRQVEALLRGRHGSTVTLSLKDPRTMTFSMAVITRAAGHLARDGPEFPLRFVAIDPEDKWDDEHTTQGIETAAPPPVRTPRAGEDGAPAGVAPALSKARPFESEAEEIAAVEENVSRNTQKAAAFGMGVAEGRTKETVVGKHAAPYVGMRVKMREAFMDRGPGTVTSVCPRTDTYTRPQIQHTYTHIYTHT